MSLGNDLVCLTTVGQTGRHRQQRFIDKVCVAAEQKLLRQTIAPEPMLWWLWSLKEAAYKYAQRLRPDLLFRPTHYTLSGHAQPPEVVQVASWAGTGFDLATAAQAHLQTPIGPVWSVSIRTAQCLMSVVAASADDVQLVQWAIVPVSSDRRDTQSAEVRRAMADQYRTRHRLPDHVTLTFGKAGQNAGGAGWPTIQLDNQPQACLLSFSHDGPYVAYALLDR